MEAQIRSLMDSRGWTQADLARELSISQGYVSRLIRGSLLPGRMLKLRISRIIEVGAASEHTDGLGARVELAAAASPEFRALIEAALRIANKNA